MKEIVLNHPMVTHKLSVLRDKKTPTKEFREIISELAIILCYEATKNITLSDINYNIKTKTSFVFFSRFKLLIVVFFIILTSY